MQHFENFSQAAENNKIPILNVLRTAFTSPAMTVLEIGSGAGQHVIFFAQELTHVHWQPTDQGEYFEGLKRNVRQSKLPNILPPLYLDLSVLPWPVSKVNYLYSANVLHIVSRELVIGFFTGAGQVVNELLCVYGPFKYAGKFTTPSNEQFDNWLKSRDSASGIKDFEWLEMLAGENGFSLLADHSMPANNQLLVFRKEK